MSAKYYITTAIDYVNSKPHLGTAYEKITADAIARYRRMMGFDTFFLMGNDEHSINVRKRAEELEMEPLDYCNIMEGEFTATWTKLNIRYDDFIRTTQKRHVDTTQRIFERIWRRGDIYKGVYRGWYCVSCEAFIQEKDLKDGQCPVHESRPQWLEEGNYFFRLSSYRERLMAHIHENPEFIMPVIRRNEILSLLEEGVEDISVSRPSTSWGIPVPFDTSAVIYVWFDALINYISGAGFSDEPGKFQHYWPADLHVIGKDITRFHAVIWPAMLMSAGVELPLSIFGHGWVNFRGEKMSKSLGTAVSPLEAADIFGPDPLRFFLMREITFGKDGDFSWERFEERYNSDLANDLGNLISRVFSMLGRYREGRIRRTRGIPFLVEKAQDAARRYREKMDHLHLEEGLDAIFELISQLNNFVQKKEPWNLVKRGEEDELDTVLYNLCEGIRFAARHLYPFMPGKMETVYRSMNIEEGIGDCGTGDEWGCLRDGARIEPPSPLFPRLVKR